MYKKLQQQTEKMDYWLQHQNDQWAGEAAKTTTTMTQRKNQYYPETVTHPGFTLEEKLNELGMGPKEFAVRTEIPEKTIRHILAGRSSITPEMAIIFEDVLHIPAEFWLNRQNQFNEALARQNGLS